MKNVSLVLNVILLVAVAVLYYLHFSGPSTKKSFEPTAAVNLQMAYIHSDSVLKNYDYFKVNRDKLEAKGKKLDADLQNRAQSLQAEFENYQRTANNLTQGQARAVEEDLQKKRQNLQLYQESLAQEMGAEQEKMTADLYNRVTSFLKTYGRDRGLQVVFKYNSSSDLLYASDSLDVSKDVAAGLNDLYKSELAGGGDKKDTTAVMKK